MPIQGDKYCHLVISHRDSSPIPLNPEFVSPPSSLRFTGHLLFDFFDTTWTPPSCTIVPLPPSVLPRSDRAITSTSSSPLRLFLSSTCDIHSSPLPELVVHIDPSRLTNIDWSRTLDILFGNLFMAFRSHRVL